MPRNRVRIGIDQTLIAAPPLGPAAPPGRPCRWPASGGARPRRPRAAPTSAGGPRPPSRARRRRSSDADHEGHHPVPPLVVGYADDGGVGDVRVCSRSRAATAGVGTLTPPLTTTSSSRPSTCSRPSSSSRPASEVRNQPSTSASAVAAGSPSYPSNSVGPPSRIRPSSADRDRDPVEGTAVVDAAAGGLGHAVGRHHPDPGRLGPLPQQRVDRPAAEQHRVQARQGRDVCLRVEQPVELGRHQRGVGRLPRSSAQPSSTGSWPATRDRTITCTPATYDAGSRSAQRPSLPSRRAVAATLASTARRDSSTRLGAPVDPDVSTTAAAGPPRRATPATQRPPPPARRRHAGAPWPER